MIVIITAVFPPEPVVSANLSYDIASELSVTNNVTVISPKPSRPFGFQFKKEPLDFNFKHLLVNSFVCASSSIIGRFKESYSFGKHCYRYIAENYNNINLLYANTWPLFGQYFVVKAAKKFNIPLIIHVQDIYPESFSNKMPFGAFLLNRLFLPLDKFILSNSTKIIVISEKMKKHLRITRNLKNNNICVIRNWQDESAYMNCASSRNNKLFTFMYLGNISPAAGVDILIHSFQKANLKDSQLIIAGSGSDLESCLRIAQQYKNVNIHFIEAPTHLVPSIQSQADVLMLPLKKGIGLTASPSKLPSYMFSAKPIIACVDSDSDTEQVINLANCGWVLRPDNRNDLANLMRMVAQVPRTELKQKGKNGFEFAIEYFSKSKNLDKLIYTFNELMS